MTSLLNCTLSCIFLSKLLICDNCTVLPFGTKDTLYSCYNVNLTLNVHYPFRTKKNTQVTNVCTYSITRDGIYDYIDKFVGLKHTIYSKCFR